jgi:glycosyltransferase involved in cell wall biosynthesis
MEAMAAGIPPLATDSGATRELVTDEAGILVSPGDRQALADGFGRLIASTELRGRLAESARMRVAAGFDAERIAGTLRAMIESASAT